MLSLMIGSWQCTVQLSVKIRHCHCSFLIEKSESRLCLAFSEWIACLSVAFGRSQEIFTLYGDDTFVSEGMEIDRPMLGTHGH